MKILIVADVLGEKNNGTTMAAYNLIEALTKRGHQVSILCCDGDKKGRNGFFVCDTINFGIFNGYVAKNGVSLAKADELTIRKALKGVDLVHCMMPFSLGAHAAKIANSLNIPITAGFHVQAENFTSHFFAMRLTVVNPTVYRVFWRKLYRFCDAIHFPTKFIEHDFERAVGPTNGYVISNGVKKTFTRIHVNKPDALRDKFCILYTGRYSKEKYHKVLIEAMKYTKYEKDIQLIFAGDGPQRKHIKKMSKHLSNEPILGTYSQEELIRVINYSDLYVHCAYAELESIACLEAISCGLVPLINNTKRTATKNFALDDNNLFECNNAKDLAKKIDYWIEHPEEKKVRSDEYLDFTKHFEFEHCMDRMEKMMLEAVEIRQYKKENGLKNRVITYNNPLTEDYACNNIKEYKLKNDFKYVHTNKIWRLCSHILYTSVAKPLVFVAGKICRGIKVKNKNVLKSIRKTGYFLYGNHTSPWDGVTSPGFIATNKKTYTVANAGAVSIRGLHNLVMMLGALPVPNNPKNTKNFLEAIELRVKQNQVIAIFPEAHIWPYCQIVRPFTDVSFVYPVRFNKPVVAMATTFRRQKKNSSYRHRPRITITLSEPIYPNPSLSEKENMKYLRDQVYDFLNSVVSKAPKVDYITYIKAKPLSARFEK